MLRRNFSFVGIFLAALCSFPAYAQNQNEKPAKPEVQEKSPTEHQQMNMPGMTMEKESPAQHEQMNMPGMNMPGMNASMNQVDMYLMREASGTGVNPSSATMEMLTRKFDSWALMFHVADVIDEVQQTGPRGGDKFFSTNAFMGMAERHAGKGTFLVRAMLSLEPATVTKRRYPELFQTGETAFGKPIIDGQHPHDFFMELSMQYARRLSEKTILDLYFAPVGDPALGPVAYPHRISAEELPQATLGHHLQDSTHLANEVITAGLSWSKARIEASGFHGAEPDEYRWDIDHGAVDSWSTRLTLTPSNNWSGQVSLGRLTHPEALDPGDIVRSTASVTYNKPLATGVWATSLIWGRNHKIVGQRNINSYLAESVFQFQQKNYITGRIELVDKDELFSDQPGITEPLTPTAGSVFRITAYTIGYTRDFKLFPGIESGLGGNFTVYGTPSAIKPFYGDHPASFLVYLRFRIKGSGRVHQGGAN